MPFNYTWNKNGVEERRNPIQGHSDVKFYNALGRVFTVHPTQHECFVLRMLLHEIKGPKSFDDFRTI